MDQPNSSIFQVLLKFSQYKLVLQKKVDDQDNFLPSCRKKEQWDPSIQGNSLLKEQIYLVNEEVIYLEKKKSQKYLFFCQLSKQTFMDLCPFQQNLKERSNISKQQEL